MCALYTAKSLESGQKASILLIDFRAANHQEILNKLCSMSIGGSVLSMLRQFLSKPSQHVKG